MDLDKIYESYDEDKRLNRTKARGIEFLTTTSFIDRRHEDYWYRGWNRSL